MACTHYLKGHVTLYHSLVERLLNAPIEGREELFKRSTWGSCRMNALAFLLLVAITVNAGPDQSVRFARQPTADAPGFVQLSGIVTGTKAFQWQFPFPEPQFGVQLTDPRSPAPKLVIYHPGRYRVWLVASDGKHIVTDEVMIVVE
jgi:hypothetical protein